MRIAILGGKGVLGAKVARLLEDAGHEVSVPSRSSGVDARSGDGLDAALRGVDVVVDALNLMTLRRSTAQDFFGTSAGNVAAAAQRAGVKRVVLVSIAGAADPAVNKRYGYYAGKAAQEAAYLSSGVPVTVVHSAQWFELVDDIVKMVPLGPVALLPTMKMAPVAADAAARLVARVAAQDVQERGGRHRSVAIRGPEEATGAQFARRIAAVRGRVGGRTPKVFWELPLFGRGVAGGGLIPTGVVRGVPGLGTEEVVTDAQTVREWAARG